VTAFVQAGDRAGGQTGGRGHALTGPMGSWAPAHRVLVLELRVTAKLLTKKISDVGQNGHSTRSKATIVVNDGAVSQVHIFTYSKARIKHS
jgi:hypothetical protein